MSRWADPLRARWAALAPRERTWVAVAAALLAVAGVWWLAIGPALATLRSAPQQHRELDAQLQRMLALKAQAQAMQSQPRLGGGEDAVRALEASVQASLGTTGRLAVVGDRATLTLAGARGDTLAQWLNQARVNARARPAEARLNRNANGLWEGTLVLSLPPR